MKIGIDARVFGPKQGGLGRYIEQLVLNLEKIDHAIAYAKTTTPQTTNEYVIFLRKENFNEYEPTAPNFKKVLADVPWYGWREQILLPRILKKEKADLMHFPHWNVPLFYRRPFVVTIHDLLLLHYPTRAASTLGPLSYFFKNTAYRLVLNSAVRHAQHILTPCEFVKGDIVKTLNIKAEKISVTLLAPPTNLKSSNFNNTPPPSLPTQPYILYVGVAFPHKNLLGLIRAWKIFNEKFDNSYRLVLVGNENYFYRQLKNHPLVKELSAIGGPASGGKNKPIFTGFVPDSQLAHFYQNASLYAFPSLYEGFGLPPLEAMQYDLPVVSSNATCLPEILQDAALYFNPIDPVDMATKINTALTDENLRQNLKNNGQKLLKKYSWQTTAEQTLQIYQTVDN